MRNRRLQGGSRIVLILDDEILPISTSLHPSDSMFVPLLFSRLELELVNLVTPGKAEGGLQVLGEVVNLLNVGEEGGINGLR